MVPPRLLSNLHHPRQNDRKALFLRLCTSLRQRMATFHYCAPDSDDTPSRSVFKPSLPLQPPSRAIPVSQNAQRRCTTLSRTAEHFPKLFGRDWSTQCEKREISALADIKLSSRLRRNSNWSSSGEGGVGLTAPVAVLRLPWREKFWRFRCDFLLLASLWTPDYSLVAAFFEYSAFGGNWVIYTDFTSFCTVGHFDYTSPPALLGLFYTHLYVY